MYFITYAESLWDSPPERSVTFSISFTVFLTTGSGSPKVLEVRTGATTVSLPFFSFPMKWLAPPCSIALVISSGVASCSVFPREIFSLRERGSIGWSWRNIALALRMSLSLYELRSCPSNNISPLVGSCSRVRSLIVDDFPDPLTPTITTSWPGLTWNEISDITSFDVPGYVNETFLYRYMSY